MKKWLRSPFFIKLRHWEYWNSKVVYAPLYPYWLWLSFKARSFYFLTAANPRIKNGGFIMESKRDVYDLLPAHFYPATILFQPGTPIAEIVSSMSGEGIAFPLIAKPDIGERGLGVKKINSDFELEAYVSNMPVPYLIQKFIPYEHEAGIFYCKLPGMDKGYISGIVSKEQVAVVGDGISTLAMLVLENDRYLLQWAQIKAMHAELLDTIPEAGKKIILVPYGNHCRGSKFTDHTYRANEKLSTAIDRICSTIPEFYYGRLDILFKSWEALERGEDLSIIEVNGSGSEPTHIYDPAHSIFFAWSEIMKHWKVLYAICKANNKNGVRYITLAEGNKERRSFRVIDNLLAARVW